jgi:hypothetical protein
MLLAKDERKVTNDGSPCSKTIYEAKMIKREKF